MKSEGYQTALKDAIAAVRENYIHSFNAAIYPTEADKIAMAVNNTLDRIEASLQSRRPETNNEK
jgi:hypothetical protein